MFKFFERIYIVVALMYFVEGLIPTTQVEGKSNLDHANVILQMVLFPIFAALLVKHWRTMWEAIRVSGWPMALCGLALASAAWSSDPGFTLRRAGILLATTLFGIYMASCFEWEEQIGSFTWMLALAVFGSFVVIALFPQYGVSYDLHWGDWKGLFPHKNSLGMKMGFGILLLTFSKAAEIPTWLRRTVWVGSAVLLVFSKSATPLVSAAFCIAILPLLQAIRLRARKTVPLWLAVFPLFLVVAWAALSSSDSLLGVLGRDATLTGRTALWSAVEGAIQQKPWLGYGYAVFWNPNNEDSAAVKLLAGWNAPHAHNGYLDTCLDLGLVGLSIFACGFFSAFWRALRLFKNGSINGSKLPLLYLIFFLVYNCTESSVFRTHTFLWLPFVWLYTSTALMEAEAVEEAPSPALLPEYAG